ncbi:MAG: hypothetical protein HQ575_00840 [Candidatus Omnitrophica bacterium]|nr:hypothetical protein [Candidatus Omnitrophota bacterium]
MALKNLVGSYRKTDGDFCFMRMDTLIERLRRMRALNSTFANIGITRYTYKNSPLGSTKER